MKKTIIFGLMLAFATSVMITSCKDDFTEEDALNEQQTVELSVYVYDVNAAAPISNANVVVLRNGKADSLKTDTQGYATFRDIEVGTTIPITIKASGYTVSKYTFNSTVTNYRQKLIAQTVGLYPLTGATTALVRGKVEIETDLTNTTSERVPAGTTIVASYNTSGIGEVSVSTTVDANGNYSLTLPSTKSAITYNITFPDLELDQKIAINGLLNDAGFPTVLPSITTLKTVFNTAGATPALPSVRPVYATIGAPNAGATAKQAVAGNVNIGGDGKVSSIAISDAGANYSTSVSNVPVSIVSLTVGSGADIKATTDGGGTVNGFSITNGGSSYPTITNVNITKVNPNVFTSITVKSGDIKVVNVHYGSGHTREKDIR